MPMFSTIEIFMAPSDIHENPDQTTDLIINLDTIRTAYLLDGHVHILVSDVLDTDTGAREKQWTQNAEIATCYKSLREFVDALRLSLICLAP